MTTASPPNPPNSIWSRLKSGAAALKTDVIAVYLASRDHRVPWYARLVAIAVAAYALSPIDLIPDFIPVLGYLDDLLLLPLGVMLVIRLIPVKLFEELRQQARSHRTKPSIAGAIFVVLAWAVLFGVLAWLLLH